MRPIFFSILLSSLLGVSPVLAEPKFPEQAAWLQEYLRIDTSNPPGQEHRSAAFLAYLLNRERIETRILVSPGGRSNLWARLPAARPSGRGAVLLTHHMDVVPAGPDWRLEPFGGQVVGGELWGRGAIDTKGLGIAHLAAMIELKRRQVPLSRDLCFLAVADEELGGGEGMAWLWRQHPELFTDVDVVLNEGGSARQTQRGILWWEIEVSQKRPLWLLLRARGQAGHGSSHAPESAAHVLINAMARMLAIPRPYRVTAPVRRYFQALAPLHANKTLRRTFAEIDRIITPKGPDGFIFPGMHKLFVDTVQVTGLAASTSINVIAAEATARVDVRLLPDSDSERFLADLKQTLGAAISVEVLLTAPVAEPSPTDTSAWAAITRGLGDKPLVPAVSAGFTDSRHFRERGIAAYGVMPFAISGEEAAGIHAANERLSLEELHRGIERMRKIVEALLLRE